MSRREFRTFLFAYEYAGREWTLEIEALDETDAWRRINRLRFARFEGELIQRVKVPAGGLLCRVIEWVAVRTWRR